MIMVADPKKTLAVVAGGKQEHSQTTRTGQINGKAKDKVTLFPYQEA